MARKTIEISYTVTNHRPGPRWHPTSDKRMPSTRLCELVDETATAELAGTDDERRVVINLNVPLDPDLEAVKEAALTYADEAWPGHKVRLVDGGERLCLEQRDRSGSLTGVKCAITGNVIKRPPPLTNGHECSRCGIPRLYARPDETPEPPGYGGIAAELSHLLVQDEPSA